MIIKIDQDKTLKSSPDQVKRKHDIINVFNGDYGEKLKAYFIRSRTGTALFVNQKLTQAEKARAINRIKSEIERCGISEMGMIFGNWQYKCNGICCKNKLSNKEGSG